MKKPRINQYGQYWTLHKIRKTSQKIDRVTLRKRDEEKKERESLKERERERAWKLEKKN